MDRRSVSRIAPFVIGTALSSAIALFGAQTNWVSDDWYGSRVSLESATKPVYSHYAPGAMAVWRAFVFTKMDRNYWALFLLLNIFILWFALAKFLKLYATKAKWSLILFPALSSSFGIYSLVYAAKGESSLPGASLCLLGTYFLHKYLRDKDDGLSGCIAVVLFVAALYFWETNLLFPAFAVVSYFMLNKVGRSEFYRLAMVILAYGFGLTTFLALYFSAGAGSLEKKIGLLESSRHALRMLYRLLLPSVVGWPFIPKRGPNLSPFVFAPESQSLTIVALLILMVIAILYGKHLLRIKVVICITAFTLLAWVYFLPISRNRSGLFGETIFLDFRYLSDLIAPFIVVVATLIIRVTTIDEPKKQGGSPFADLRFVILGLVLTGSLLNGVVSLYIYGTSSSAPVKTFLENADKGASKLKNCPECVLLDAPLPDFFGTVGVPWNSVANIMYVRGGRKPGFWVGKSAFTYLGDGRIKRFNFNQYHSEVKPPSTECSAGVTTLRGQVAGLNLWTARLVVESPRRQLVKVQFNNDIKSIELMPGLTTIWHQNFSGVDTAIVEADAPTCIRSLTTGLP